MAMTSVCQKSICIYQDCRNKRFMFTIKEVWDQVCSPENKYQSRFRQNKSTDDHLFRLSQSVMESFNTGEHVVAAFPDLEKLLTLFGTMDSGIKFSCLTFPLK